LENLLMKEKRIAIVTGYSSGLGRALAQLLLRRDWFVVGVSRSKRPAGLHKEFPDTLVRVAGSVSEQSTVEATFQEAATHGNVSLVINCAGEGVFGPIGTYTAADISQVLAANLTGLILFSDRAALAMRDSGGDIVNVLSTAGKKLRVDESVYTAAKWGAKAYTRTLREAAKSLKLPIRVFEVYPCGMRTDFWSSALRSPTDGRSFPPPEPIAETILSEVLTKREVYCLELTFERS
jgi:NAD(P)-dependent dehydrogenase (short-subunit alcohol dehydrogenase family)